MDQLIKQLKILSKKNSNIILAGDFNVIPAAEDVYNVKVLKMMLFIDLK
jgi:exodeoxyribonuclease-3